MEQSAEQASAPSCIYKRLLYFAINSFSPFFYTCIIINFVGYLRPNYILHLLLPIPCTFQELLLINTITIVMAILTSEHTAVLPYSGKFSLVLIFV